MEANLGGFLHYTNGLLRKASQYTISQEILEYHNVHLFLDNADCDGHGTQSINHSLEVSMVF